MICYKVISSKLTWSGKAKLQRIYQHTTVRLYKRLRSLLQYLCSTDYTIHNAGDIHKPIAFKDKSYWIVKRGNRGAMPSQVHDELKRVSRSNFHRQNKWIHINAFICELNTRNSLPSKHRHMVIAYLYSETRCGLKMLHTAIDITSCNFVSSLLLIFAAHM